MTVNFTGVKTEQDIESLAQLAAEIWNEYFTRIITQEQIDYMVDKFQSVPALTAQINTQGYEYYFMNVSGESIGYLGIKQEDGRLLLSKFYIQKENRGKGYASRAMDFLVELCRKRRLGVMWLTVNRHNADTIAVYEKKGFKTVRTQVADIGKGFVMDDFIMEKEIELSPIKNKVGSIFLPVRDIERSRSWYCRVLGLKESDCEIMNGHLCPLPMEGTGIILDTMPMWGGNEPGGAPSIDTPAFMLMTADLEGSYEYMKKLGAELVTGIEHNQWFVVKDPDGNKLMICRE